MTEMTEDQSRRLDALLSRAERIFDRVEAILFESAPDDGEPEDDEPEREIPFARHRARAREATAAARSRLNDRR